MNSRFDFFRSQLADAVADCDAAKTIAAKMVAEDPVCWLCWGGPVVVPDRCIRSNIVNLSYNAAMARLLLDKGADSDAALVVAARYLRDRELRDQLDFCGATSTSLFSNAVDQARAEARRWMLEAGFLGESSIRGLEKEIAERSEA